MHIAVKLKSRLIKLSIILPLGKFTAGVHHLRMLREKFGKDVHGLREKDKDTQAVLRLSSESVLASLTDAKGTVAYLNIF